MTVSPRPRLEDGDFERRRGQRRRRQRRRALVVAVLVSGLVGCGSKPPELVLSADAQRGQALALQVGCAGCHGGVDGTSTVGPSWVGRWGTRIELVDGTTVTFDEDYVARSVRDPDAQRSVESADAVRMPAFTERQLSDDDLRSITAYLRELGSAG
ncbi:MAG: c-type cytochrome [Ilumatobacteraceae bacterium]